jgi:hypothetical protein
MGIAIISLIISIIALLISTQPIREKRSWIKGIERAHEDRIRHQELQRDSEPNHV